MPRDLRLEYGTGDAVPTAKTADRLYDPRLRPSDLRYAKAKFWRGIQRIGRRGSAASRRIYPQTHRSWPSQLSRASSYAPDDNVRRSGLAAWRTRGHGIDQSKWGPACVSRDIPRRAGDPSSVRRWPTPCSSTRGLSACLDDRRLGGNRIRVRDRRGFLAD